MQLPEGFRGGTETLERLTDLEREFHFIKEIGNYNLVFTVLILIICLVKTWMVVRNGHRIDTIERNFNEANERGRTFYAIGHRVQENQEHFRVSIKEALDLLGKLEHRQPNGTFAGYQAPHNGHENKAANTVNINHPGEPKTPEQAREIFWEYLLSQQTNANNRIRQLEQMLQERNGAPPKPRRKKNLPPTEENNN